jgi:hypothetical protein
LTVAASKQILQPGETATISVMMDGRRFSGHRSCTVYVTVGHPSFSEARLTVTALSRNDLVCNPGEVWFGAVTRGQTPSATLDLEYAGRLALRVSEAVIPKGAPFEATLKELYRRPGKVGYQVKVSLKKDTTVGPFQERILLKTNDPDTALVPVQVSGRIQAPPKAKPAGKSGGSVSSPARRPSAGS